MANLNEYLHVKPKTNQYKFLSLAFIRKIIHNLIEIYEYGVWNHYYWVIIMGDEVILNNHNLMGFKPFITEILGVLSIL